MAPKDTPPRGKKAAANQADKEQKRLLNQDFNVDEVDAKKIKHDWSKFEEMKDGQDKKDEEVNEEAFSDLQILVPSSIPKPCSSEDKLRLLPKAAKHFILSEKNPSSANFGSFAPMLLCEFVDMKMSTTKDLCGRISKSRALEAEVDASFWCTKFVRLVMCGLETTSLVPKEAANLLGVSCGRLLYCYTRWSWEGRQDLKRNCPPQASHWVTPDVVVLLLREAFLDKDRVIPEGEPPVLRPSLRFYRDNIRRLCHEIDIAFSDEKENLPPLLSSPELQELLVQAKLLDTQAPGSLELHLLPTYCYIKQHSKPGDFWSTELPKALLQDVARGVVPAVVAAWQLGITETMVKCALARSMKRGQGLASVRRYLELGFGNKEEFWKESSTVEVLMGIRDREIVLENMAAEWGVSRSELLLKCGGLKTQKELEDERTLVLLEKFNEQCERSKYKKKETQLEKQIAEAEKQEEQLSNYEKMRLSNMKERQSLLEELDFDNEKKEIFDARKKSMIFTPKDTVERRKSSARVRAKIELDNVKNENVKSSTCFEELTLLQSQQVSPPWVGQWLPLQPKETGNSGSSIMKQARNIQEGKVSPRFGALRVNGRVVCRVEDAYELAAVSEACCVPPVDLAVCEVLEHHQDLQAGLASLDSLAAEFRDLEVEPEYRTAGNPLARMGLVQETIVAGSTITAVDSMWDLIGYGTEAGGVGLALGTTHINWRPHSRAVTRSLLCDSLGLLSCSLDGSVRRTDLESQTVLLEHWGEEGVVAMERREEAVLLLASGRQVNMLDLRIKQSTSLLQLGQVGKVTSLDVNPRDNNLVSVCHSDAAVVYDLRQPSQPVARLPGTFSSCQWSPGAGERLMVVDTFNISLAAAWRPHLYVFDRNQYDRVLLSRVCDKREAVRWSPWSQDMLLFPDPKKTTSKRGSGQPSLMAVDVTSGAVVGRLELAPGTHNFLVQPHKTRPQIVVANSGQEGGLAVYEKELD